MKPHRAGELSLLVDFSMATSPGDVMFLRRDSYSNSVLPGLWVDAEKANRFRKVPVCLAVFSYIKSSSSRSQKQAVESQRNACISRGALQMPVTATPWFTQAGPQG